MSLRLGVGAFVLVGLTALPAQAQMQWKFKEGDKLYQDAAIKMNQVMKFMGQEVKQDIDIANLVSWNVKKKNADGTVVIEQTVESMKLTGGALPIDDKFFDKMKGMTFTITLSPKGEVAKVEGYAEGMKKLLGDNLGDNPIAAKMFEGMMSEDNIKKQFADLFAFLPDKPVQKGDKWARKMSQPLGPIGTLTSDRTYVYDGQATVDGKTVEKIVFTETIASTAPPAKGAGGLPFEITKVNFKADKAGGTIYFDAEAGRLVRLEQSMKLKGSMTFSIMGNNLDAEIDQDMTSVTKVSDKKP